MAEYIEREKAIELFYPVDPENDGSDGTTVVTLTGNYSSADIESMLSDMPAEDVAPVRHGYWKGFIHYGFYRFNKDGREKYRERITYHCSNCGRKTVIKEKFCPSCGFKMDSEVTHD